MAEAPELTDASTSDVGNKMAEASEPTDASIIDFNLDPLDGPCCPIQRHPLRPAPPSLKNWRCDGALFPFVCLGPGLNKISVSNTNIAKQAENQEDEHSNHCTGDDDDGNNHHDDDNPLLSLTQLIAELEVVKGTDNDATHQDNDQLLAELHAQVDGIKRSYINSRRFMHERHIVESIFGEDIRKEGSILNSFKDDSFPRFRCEENCNFDLCDVCFQYLCENESDRETCTQPDIQDMIKKVREVTIHHNLEFPPLYRNAYLRASLISGEQECDTRCHWLWMCRRKPWDEVRELNSPIFDKSLLKELIFLGAGFSLYANIRSLCHTKNASVDSAMDWLVDHVNDKDLNSPINVDGVRICPRGHLLVQQVEENSERRPQWVCDGEDDADGCERGMQSGGDPIERDVPRYRCQEGCPFDLCDLCILKEKTESVTESLSDDSDEEAEEKSEILLQQDNVDDESLVTNEEQNKAEKVSAQRETFQFANLDVSEMDIQHFDTYEEWAKVVESEIGAAELVSHRLFRTALKKIPGGEALMNFDLNLGKDHNIEHRFLVLGFSGNNNHEFFASVEKGPDGILMQKHDNLDEVKANRLVIKERGGQGYKEKRNIPVEIDFQVYTGIHRLKYMNLPLIGDLLSQWDVVLAYNLFKSNCQSFTREFRDRILKASNGVKLHLPGTNKQASLDESDKLLTYFKDRFPGWEKKKLTRIPELQSQYAILVEKDEKRLAVKSDGDGKDEQTRKEQEMKEEEEYNRLRIKQKGFEGVCKALNGRVFQSDKKVVFYDVCKERGERTQRTNEATDGLLDVISKFWKEAFEMLCLTSKHGVFIMQYNDVNSSNDSTLMKRRVELLQDLGSISVSEPCFTTVSMSIEENLKKPIVSEPDKKTYGANFKFYVSSTRMMGDMKWCVKEIAPLTMLETKYWKRVKDKLQTMIVKVTILQNMENERNLVHHRLEHQEWGKSGVMLWTETQKNCLEIGRKAFQNNEPLRLVIRGCQGSGKTLVLIRLAREFVRCQCRGKVLVHIYVVHERLIKELNEVVQQDQLMKDRVIIDHFLYDPAEYGMNQIFCFHLEESVQVSDVSAFFVDEQKEFGHGELHDIELVKALSLFRHLVSATSYRHVNATIANKSLAAAGGDIQFQEIELEGNLRSSRHIADLTKKYQKLHKGRVFCNIAIKPCLSFQSQRPEIVTVEKRDEFDGRILAEVRKSLYDSSDGKICVVPFCRRSTFEAIGEKLTPEERERVEFFVSNTILGCQFPIVILVCDLIAIDLVEKEITDAMTRATTQLKCIVHTSKQPLMIKGRPSFDRQYCSPSDIPSFFQRLCDECEGPIFVKDNDEVINEEIKWQLDLSKVDLEWQNEKEYELTKKASVLVHITKRGSGHESKKSYAPVLSLRTDDEKKAQNRFKTEKDRVDRINSFFTHQAKMLQKL